MGKHLDREYLEDYQQKEIEKRKRLLKDIEVGQFDLEKDKYPPDKRFVKIQKPVVSTTIGCASVRNIWTQIPFCGSLIINIPSMTRRLFEERLFKVSYIPKIIDYVKDTGKLQIALVDDPKSYTGLDFLDPIFEELRPPVLFWLPNSAFIDEKELTRIHNSFHTLANVRFFKWLQATLNEANWQYYDILVRKTSVVYTFLKFGRYTVVEDIENLMIDDPCQALHLLRICGMFIQSPVVDVRHDMHNLTLENIREREDLPLIYRPKEIQFQCEIGKFLLEKLTYAPKGPMACNSLIDSYDAYDLQDVLESLNEAIVTNHPDIVNKSAEELSEILDNVWNDKTIPRKVKGLQVGIPLSMAAIGTVAAGPIGAAGGFLAGLGYSVVDKFINLETEGLSEKLAKLKTKSYQANVYDFKQKYKHRIVKEKENKAMKGS